MASDTALKPDKRLTPKLAITKAINLKLPWISLTIVSFILLCACLAPIMAQHNPERINMADRRIAPFETVEHPLGTDVMGRDMASRMVYGARTTVFISLVALATGAFVGSILGMIAGYKGGWSDILIMEFGRSTRISYSTRRNDHLYIIRRRYGEHSSSCSNNCMGKICAYDPWRCASHKGI
ncbi:MAG: hypothetical protein CM1200mP15_08550 [Dehalococcoidia bacterium]|nr:MAG: hypothetical protein CM1200mP15_08550 [Dehalococcoidia bacterium]